MKKSTHLKTRMRKLLLATITAVCSILAAPGVKDIPKIAAEVSTHPNIVVIMTDDQRYDDMWVMPKTLQLLGENGATFNNHYTDYSLCCPSRATMLSGQMAKNHGVLYNTLPNGGHTKFNHANALPVWLTSQGYTTGHIGKYMNGTESKRPPGWTNWQSVLGAAFNMYNWKLNDNGTTRSYGGGAANYQTDVLSNLAVNFINQKSNAEQPFYLQVWPSAPHGRSEAGPPQPAPRDIGQYATASLPKPPSFNEANVNDKPARIKNLPLLTPTQINDMEKWYRARLESLQAVDDLVERVVNTLEANGVLENTYVVFTSDNGWEQGEHRIEKGKIQPYEEANKIPLLMRGPSIVPGSTVSRLTSNIDFAPTVTDWADVTAGLTMDGVSLQNHLNDPEFGKRRVLFVETGPYNATTTAYFYGVKTETSSIFVWQNPAKTTELYDNVNDPYQLQSQHANSAYTTQRVYLRSLVDQMKTCTGSSCFVIEP